MKEWLSVGEISKMFNLNVQTLHYYESIGIFVPESRESHNGYRRYRFDQIYKLASIRYLKKIGYSLQQIRDYMDTRDIDFSLDRLKNQSEKIMRKWEELSQVNDVIQRKIRFIEEETRHIKLDYIKCVFYPTRYYIPIGSEEILYSSDNFYFYPTVVFYRDTEKQFGALITRDGFYIDNMHTPREILAGEYLCGYHKGPYATIRETADRIYSEAERRNISLVKETVNLNIIDQFVESNPERYVTEVQIRVVEETRG